MTEKLPYEPEQELKVCGVLTVLIGRKVVPWEDGVSLFGAPGGFGPAIAPNLNVLPTFTVAHEYTNRMAQLRSVEAAADEFYRAVAALAQDEVIEIDILINELRRERRPVDRDATADDVMIAALLATGARRATVVGARMLKRLASARHELLETERAAFVPPKPRGGRDPSNLHSEEVAGRLAVWARRATGQTPKASFGGSTGGPSNPFSRAVEEIFGILGLPEPTEKLIRRACERAAPANNTTPQTTVDEPGS